MTSTEKQTSQTIFTSTVYKTSGSRYNNRDNGLHGWRTVSPADDAKR